MNNYKKFIIAKILSISVMWWTISMLYLTRRWVSPEVAVWLFWFYSVAFVVLEYPTGVIGDVYGHKKSIVLWSLISALGISRILFQRPWQAYLAWLTLHATGMSLLSGSTTALLKHIVQKDFKKKFPQSQAIVTAARAAASLIAWYLFTLSPLLAVVIPAIMALSWAAVFQTISYTNHHDQKGNIFSTAKQWRQHIYSSKNLFIFLILISCLLGLRYSIKTLVTIMENYYIIAVPVLTAVVSANFFVRTLGNISVWHISKKTAIVSTALLLFSGIFIPKHNPYILLTRLITLSYSITIIDTHIKIQITESTKTQVLATVLSTFSLGRRLTGSLILFFSWYILKRYDYGTMIVSISILMITSILYYSITKRKKTNQRERSE